MGLLGFVFRFLVSGISSGLEAGVEVGSVPIGVVGALVAIG